MTTIIKSTKLIGAAILMTGFMSGSALAGDKENCANKNHTTAEKTQTQISPPTVVLSATSDTTVYPAVQKTTDMGADTGKSTSNIYTFDEALSLCQKHGATNLQACIDKKTGRTPKS